MKKGKKTELLLESKEKSLRQTVIEVYSSDLTLSMNALVEKLQGFYEENVAVFKTKEMFYQAVEDILKDIHGEANENMPDQGFVTQMTLKETVNVLVDAKKLYEAGVSEDNFIKASTGMKYRMAAVEKLSQDFNVGGFIQGKIAKKRKLEAKTGDALATAMFQLDHLRNVAEESGDFKSAADIVRTKLNVLGLAKEESGVEFDDEYNLRVALPQDEGEGKAG